MLFTHENFWNKTLRFIIFSSFVGIYKLETPTNVIISNWTLPDNKIGISCSVSADIKAGEKVYNVHLMCPFVDSTSCYVNCNSQCIQESGECIDGTLKRIFYSCNYVRSRENKIDLYYQLNIRYITVEGQWLCAYGGIKSPAIIIGKYSSQVVIPTAKSTFSTTSESYNLQKQSEKILKSSALPSYDVLTNFEMKTIVFVILGCLSVLVNVILAVWVCINRRNLQKSKRKFKQNENYKDPIDTTSMLTKSSTHQQILSRSNRSHTPSLDSPYCRESIATFLPEGSTIISSSPMTTDPFSYYIDPNGRVIRVMPPINNYPAEGINVLTRQSSGESISSSRPIIPSNIVLATKMPQYGSYVKNWGYMTPQNQESYISTRGCSSQQQIFVDSNDESGLGSQSLNNSAKVKHESFHGGSDKIDLIQNCDSSVNDIIRPVLNIQQTSPVI